MNFPKLEALLTDIKALLVGKKPESSAADTDISGKVTALEQQIAGELTAAATKLTEAQGKVTALEAEKTTLTSQLAEANGKVTSLTTSVTAANAAAETALVNFKLAETDAAGKRTGIAAEAPLAEKVTAIAGGVTAVLARQGIAANQIVSAIPSKTGADSNVKTRAQFTAMAPKEQLAFVNGGGKIKD